MDDQHLIWCGPDVIPQGRARGFKSTLHLNSFPSDPNIFLKLDNISSKLAQNIPPLVMDMLEVGSYVYSADQAVSRGGKTSPGDGRRWVRNFHFAVPVRLPELWSRPNVKEYLKQTLGFLSEDHYEFEFRQSTSEVPVQQYFDFDQGKPWFKADEVLLFSGGLDSLAGAIDEIINKKKNVILVSHRPVAKLSKWQKNLKDSLIQELRAENRILHVPVWCNKSSKLTKDNNQRTRSFLFAMLAASVAIMHNLRMIKFYENGVISLNLPLSEQFVGAKASRSTHPEVLRGFAKLLSELTSSEFCVENPFCWSTKAEAVDVIRSAGLGNLIKLTNSCSHVRNADLLQNHCGVCLQCVERRLATLCKDNGEEDSDEMYKIRLFTDAIEKGPGKVIVGSYFSYIHSIMEMEPVDFFEKFGEAFRAFRDSGMPSGEVAERMFEMSKRHANQVMEVVTKQIEIHADDISHHRVHPDSLLAMLIRPEAKKDGVNFASTFPTPVGADWKDVKIEIVSNNSAAVTVMDLTKRYTAFDMGFTDRRKRDLPNKQWDLLVDFAESNGVLNWGTHHEKRLLYKSIQLLKQTLKSFFSIQTSPILDYRKKIGYATKFTISRRD